MSARVGRSAFHPLLAGAGALICAAGLAIGLTIWWLHSHAINEASANAGTLATVLAEQANRSVQSVDLVLSDLKKELSSANTVQTRNSDDLNGENVYRLILDRLSHLSQAERILVIDRFGHSANTTVKFPSDPVDLSDRDYFKHFKNNDDGRIFISSVIDRRTGKNLVVFTKRINSPDGEFAGVVLISVDFTYFEAIYNSISRLHDQTFVLLHRDGKVIVRYLDGKTHIGEKMPATSEWHKYVVEGGGEFKGKSVFDNERRLVAVRPLQDYPLVVNVGVTESSALATWRIQATTIGFGTLLVLICSGGLLIALNRQFRRVVSSELALVKKSKELEKSNATVDAALNNMSQGLVTFDATATMIICNRRYLEMYGLSDDIVKPGCPLRTILANRVAAGNFRADVIEQYACEIISAAAAGRKINKTIELPDGRIINVVNEPTADGGWVATHEDITERTQAGDELRRTKKFIDAVIEQVPLPIIVKDVAGLDDACGSRFTLFNRAYEELTGESRTQLIGKTAHELFPKERADLIVQADNEALQSDQVVLTSEHPIVTAHNGTRAVIAKKTVIRDEDGKPQYLLTVVDDVTERRLSDARIVHLAHYDSLTDLPNRTTFNSTLAATLDRAKASGEQFAVLSIDLDRFKEANDTYGHMVGDTLLREVARRLQVAAGGAFTARLGGDEFMLVVANGAQPATASALADRLLATFRDDFEVEGHQLKLGMSIGVAIYPTDGTDAKALIANADIALYRAKAEFRGSALFYEAEMGDRLRERHAMQEDLRLALDRGELLLHYQPQLKMSGEIVGFEALVRWQCPKRGMVPPGAFIPVAEESGLIIPVGDWVLREACREAASWPQPLTIAVNISPIQFHSGDLPRLVHAILLETGLAPARLELEVTEGVMISDFSRAVSILNQLKSLGVRIAMDDFGTGYSSLSYLQSFRCDKIKIDRVFICDLESNYHSRAIVRAVVGLGQSLNLPVLAEGVETEAQHDYLAQEGCDEVQGYLTGRPQPIEDYAELIGRRVIAQQRHAVA